MDRYDMNAGPVPLEKEPKGAVLVPLTSEELEPGAVIPGLEHILCHTPDPRDARVCKAESRR